MSGTNLKTISEMSGLPFYDVRFIVFLSLISVLFAVLFFGLLKKMNKKSEQKEFDLFFSLLDNLCLGDERERIVKIFTVVYTKFNRNFYFLGFGVENTLSIQDKNLLKSFEKKGELIPYSSDNFKNFKLQNIEEFQIYKKIINKLGFKSMLNGFMIVGLLLLFLLALVYILCLFIHFFLK